MYISAKKAAEKWGVSDRRVRILCAEGKIPGAFQQGRGWKIPLDAVKPKVVLAFGDYSYYNIGDRGSRSFAELKELYAGNGMVGYVAKERVDGKLVLPEAVQLLKMKAA